MMIRKNIMVLLAVFLMMTVFFAGFALSQEPQLVARWALDEADGNTVLDFVGKNDGEMIGKPERVNGMFGRGVKFDQGTGQYIEVPMSEDLELPESITWMIWVNVTSSAGRQELFCYGDAYVIHIDGGVFKAYIHQGGVFPRAPGKTAVETNKWYFLAATYDSKVLNFYLDGKLDGSAKLPGEIGFLNLPLRFSNNPAAPGESWGIKGVIDEIEIWDKPMTEEQILRAYEFPLEFLAVNTEGKITTLWGYLKSK